MLIDLKKKGISTFRLYSTNSPSFMNRNCQLFYYDFINSFAAIYVHYKSLLSITKCKNRCKSV